MQNVPGMAQIDNETRGPIWTRMANSGPGYVFHFRFGIPDLDPTMARTKFLYGILLTHCDRTAYKDAEESSTYFPHFYFLVTYSCH